MNWSSLPDDVFQLARHLIKKCSSSRLNQNRPLYSISVNGWKLILLPPVLPAKLQDAGRPEKKLRKIAELIQEPILALGRQARMRKIADPLYIV